MHRLLKAVMDVVLTLCICVGLPIFAITGLYSLKFGHCKIFPNGTEVGYEAFVDFGNVYAFQPKTAIRDRSGKVLVNLVWPLHITEKATFGVARASDGSLGSFAFIWTPDAGLVRKDENPEIHESLRQDLGAIYYGAPKDEKQNTRWFLNRLEDGEQFNSDDCNTSLWTW